MTNTKIQALANKIKELITTHANVTANSSTKGHVQSSNLVKDVRVDGTSNVGTDNGYYALADHEHKISNASTSAYGITKLSNSTSSTSQVLAATPKAVKTAYDLANGKPDLGTTSTTAATGDHTHDYSKVSVSQTKTSGIEIGKVTIDGVSTPLYQQDNNTTYTAASTTPIADTSSGAVGTSAKYAREDHIHPQSTLYAEAAHTHTKTNITDYFTSDNISANDSLNDYKTEGIYCCGYYNANQSELPTSVSSVGYTLIVIKNNQQVKKVENNRVHTYESIKQILISEDNEIFIRKYYEIKLGGMALESSEWTSWVKKDITYSVATSSNDGLMSSSDKIKIDNTPILRYGTLSGTTSAYTVSISGLTELVHGTLIAVYNNNVGNSVSGATLKVNDFNALPIYYKSTAINGSTLQNKTFNLLMYNNTLINSGCWQLLYAYNSTYTAASATPIADTSSGAVGTSSKYYMQKQIIIIPYQIYLM